jgi:hypothetical protein
MRDARRMNVLYIYGVFWKQKVVPKAKEGESGSKRWVVRDEFQSLLTRTLHPQECD